MKQIVDLLHPDSRLGYFLKPKLLPFVFSLLSVPLLSLLVEFAISSMDIPYASPRDIQTHISKRLSYHSSLPAVYNIGGSGFLRSLDDEEELKQAFNYQYDFITLAYPGQTFVESLMLLQHADIKRGDLVVLHASISRVNRIYPDNKLTCSPYVHQLFYRDVISTLEQLNLDSSRVSPLCHLSFIAKRKLLPSLLYSVWPQSDSDAKVQYLGVHPQPFEKGQKELDRKRQSVLKTQRTGDWFRYRWLEFDESSFSKTEKVLRAIDRYVSSRGAKLVIIDPPQNREWFSRYHSVMDQWYIDDYRKLFAKLSEVGVEYHDLRKLHGYLYEDFYDHQHMIQSGRDKFLPIYKQIVLEGFRKTRDE